MGKTSQKVGKKRLLACFLLTKHKTNSIIMHTIKIYEEKVMYLWKRNLVQ